MKLKQRIPWLRKGDRHTHALQSKLDNLMHFLNLFILVLTLSEWFPMAVSSVAGWFWQEIQITRKLILLRILHLETKVVSRLHVFLPLH